MMTYQSYHGSRPWTAKPRFQGALDWPLRGGVQRHEARATQLCTCQRHCQLCLRVLALETINGFVKGLVWSV